MSPSKRSPPPHRSRKPHTTGRHGAALSAIRRPAPPVRPHVAMIEALDSFGWRVTEIRPASRQLPALWHVTVRRVDLVASMSVTATDPDVALEELARYAAADAP